MFIPGLSVVKCVFVVVMVVLVCMCVCVCACEIVQGTYVQLYETIRHFVKIVCNWHQLLPLPLKLICCIDHLTNCYLLGHGVGVLIMSLRKGLPHFIILLLHCILQKVRLLIISLTLDFETF